MARPMRDRLKTAADLLQEAGHDDYAADVRAILAPAGWTLLRPEPGSGTKDANVPLSMAETLKKSLVLAGEEMGVSLSAVAREGYLAVAEGRWVPPRILTERRRRGSGPVPKTNLNVRVPQDLVDRVRPLLPKLTEELGYRVSMNSIGAAWLAEELGVDQPSADDLGRLPLVTAKRLVDHVFQEVERRGTTVDEVVSAGIRDLLAGSWDLPMSGWNAVSARPREGGVWTVDPKVGPRYPVKVAKIVVRLPEDLLGELRVWCAARSETSELPVHPGTVGIAILKDRLGEPPAE
ncbi:hypothetical protein ACIRNU_34415 [Streptomyces rochei]|uniref:hypothetical protein n=1 Tax=Streptomyces rochei TaxID=1928 RepID=UPI003804C3C3